MAKFIGFFPREVYMCDSASPGTPSPIYSEIYEVADVQTFQWEARIFAKSASNVTGQVTLEHSDDISATAFGQLDQINVTGGVGSYMTGTVAGTPRRYLRAKLNVLGTASSAQYLTISFSGRGFC